MEAEFIKYFIQRIDHLENILFSSAFGLLITTTFAIFAAIYSLRSSTNISINPSLIIIGASIIYVLLSGYYYFILTHFYAVASAIIPLRAKIPETIEIERFWTSFQLSIPFLNEKWKIYFGLLNAPLFPFLFSSLSIISIWWIVAKEARKFNKWMPLALGIFLQLIIFFLMIWYPFNEFIKLIL